VPVSQGTMIPYLRRKRILELLCENEIMSLEALQKQLAPSSLSTLRRDILSMQQSKQVQMLRGGSVKLATAEDVELPVAEKAHMNIDSKERIARSAASFVRNGETIYIDSGTTTARMTHYLKDKDITIVTSNTYILNDANKLQGSLILLGGELNKAIASINGPTTDMQLSEMLFDRAFIGASGFSLHGGVSTFDMREASKKRIVKANAQITYVLADSSKAGRNTLCKAFPLTDCVLITDQENELTAQISAVIAP